MSEYKLSKTIESPGMIVRVFRPELTEEERERRMKQIKEAAARLIIASNTPQKAIV